MLFKLALYVVFIQAAINASLGVLAVLDRSIYEDLRLKWLGKSIRFINDRRSRNSSPIMDFLFSSCALFCKVIVAIAVFRVLGFSL